MHKIVSGVAVAAMLAGCATPPKDIAPTYVSPILYQGLTCQQLGMEAQRVSQAAAAASGAQADQASNDAAMVGVSLILFWPAAFFVGGDKGNATEVARLKGEMTAIEQANVLNGCGIQFRGPMPHAAPGTSPRRPAPASSAWQDYDSPVRNRDNAYRPR